MALPAILRRILPLMGIIGSNVKRTLPLNEARHQAENMPVT